MSCRKIFLVLLFFSYSRSRAQNYTIKKIKLSLPNITDSTKYVDALNRMAFLFYESHPDSTFIYALKTREIANRIGYLKGNAILNNTFGIVFFVKGNWQLALRYFNDSYDQSQLLRDTASMTSATTNIAACYASMGKNQKAVVYYKRAIKLVEGAHRDSLISQLLANYILQCSDYIPTCTKTRYINKARYFAKKYKDEKQLLALNQIIADEKINQNHRTEGIRLLQRTIAQTLKLKLYFFSMDMLLDIGRHLEKTDPEQTIKYYKQGLKIAQEKKYKDYIITFSRKLYEICAKKEDFVNAYSYSRILIDMRDDQIKIDNKSGVDYLEYAIKDKQLTSALQQKKYQSYFLYFSIAVCLLTGIIIIILWHNWMKSKKIATVLRTQFRQSESTTESLETMNKNYAKIIKVVAHDLRNPISAIKTIADSILPDKELSSDMVDYVELIRSSSISCLDMIGELLKADFDQGEHINKREVELNHMLQQCRQLLSFKAKDKNQELVLNTTAQINIRADKEKLLRVLGNIITNAIKFSPSGGKIYIGIRKHDDYVINSKKDNGIGISPASVDKIFDPFTTARRTGTNGEEPFGLGLYISKRIVEAHNGKIWLTSQQGIGTTFYIKLYLSNSNTLMMTDGNKTAI